MISAETSLDRTSVSNLMLAHLNQHGYRTFGDLARLDLAEAATWYGIGRQRLRLLAQLQRAVHEALDGQAVDDSLAAREQRGVYVLSIPENIGMLISGRFETLEAASEIDLYEMADEVGVGMSKLRSLALLKFRALRHLEAEGVIDVVPPLTGLNHRIDGLLRVLGLNTREALAAWLPPEGAPLVRGRYAALALLSLEDRALIRTWLASTPPTPTPRPPSPSLVVQPTWEVISHLLRPSLCQVLFELGCKTLDDLKKVGPPHVSARVRASIRRKVELAFSQPPLPTTLPGLVEFLLAHLTPERQTLTVGHYMDRKTYEVLAGHHSWQAVEQRIRSVEYNWQHRYPWLVPTLMAPLLEALEEAEGLLAPEVIAALGLTVPQAALLLQATGRMSLRWVRLRSRSAHTYFDRWQMSHPPYPVDRTWLTTLTPIDLNRRMAAFRGSVRALERPRIDRDHLLQIWDENTGLPLPPEVALRLMERVLDQPIPEKGLLSMLKFRLTWAAKSNEFYVAEP